MATRFDVIVLGAGPAGLTAGIYLSRAKKSVLIIDTSTAGGQPIFTHMVANYPGLGEIKGYELAFAMKEQAKTFGCEIEANVEITEMDITGEMKRVVVDDEDEYEAPAIILAVGGTPRGLGLDSEEEFKARGISYCATCDGDFFTDKEIVVIGGGNTALEESVSLTQFATKVTILHQFDHFQAFEKAVDEAKANERIDFIMEVDVVAFEGGEQLERVRYRDKKTGEEHTIETEGVFIFIGYQPNSAPFKDVVALSPAGEILADENMATNVPGVFVAGDVRQKRYRQITTAVADGTIAALVAMDYVNALEAGEDASAPRGEAPTLT